MRFFKKGIIFLSFACYALMLASISNNVVQAEENSENKIIYLNQIDTANNSIFNNENSISPGYTAAKEFYINNNNKFSSSINGISIQGKLYDRNGKILDSDKPEYKDFLNNSIITFYCEDKEVFKGTLAKYISLDLSNDSIILDKSASKKCTLKYELSAAAGNSIMGLEYKFNINFNYSEVPVLFKTGQLVDFEALILIGTLICSIGLSLIINKKLLNIKFA